VHANSAVMARGLLDALAAGTPAPGGGAAAALAGATGASLLLMVARLPRTKAGPEAAAGLAGAIDRIGPLRETLITLIDRDAEAYSEVIRARALSRGAQSEDRRQAIEAAAIAATETQMDVMRACSGCLLEASIIAQHGARSALTDLDVAITLVQAAARAAALTVTANLGMINNPEEARRIGVNRDRLTQEITERRQQAEGAVPRSRSGV